MHPYFQASVNAYAAAGWPYFHQMTAPEARALLQSLQAYAPKPRDLPDLAGVDDFSIMGPHGPIPVRRYRPLGASAGTCVYFHSGGWVIGDLDQADASCRRLAAAAGCELVSVDYRLAPEHPFPQPLDDAYAALEWAAHEKKGALLVAGESAGANLAAACAIRAREFGGPALAGQFLSCPVTDHDFETASYRAFGGLNWLLSTADMRWFWDHYCPPDVDRNNPLVSPLRVANAAGLPRALIHIADLDPLRDEGRAYAAHLSAAGVPTVLRHDPEMLHGYLSVAGAVAQAAEALAQAGQWIHECLCTASSRRGQWL